jgi:hypothetical protein
MVLVIDVLAPRHRSQLPFSATSYPRLSHRPFGCPSPVWAATTYRWLISCRSEEINAAVSFRFYFWCPPVHLMGTCSSVLFDKPKISERHVRNIDLRDSVVDFFVSTSYVEMSTTNVLAWSSLSSAIESCQETFGSTTFSMSLCHPSPNSLQNFACQAFQICVRKHFADSPTSNHSQPLSV